MPIRLLERLAIPDEDLPGILRGLAAVPGVRAVMILATCNRLEAYLDCERSPAEAARIVAEAFGLPAEFLVVLRAARAVQHLCSVAGGLESMALGEHQILTQVRKAARQAEPSLGPRLSRAVAAAVRAGRRIRAETELARGGGSLVTAGLRLATAELGGLRGRTALVFGTGAVGRRAAYDLRELGIGSVLIANRSRTHAARLAEAVGGEVVEPTALAPALARCDLVVTAVRSAEPVVSAGDVRTGPLFVLDLGMPRNVDPNCGEIPGVTLMNIEDLGRRLASRSPSAEVERARAIVAEEVAGYLTAVHEEAAAPLITALHGQARDLMEAELVRMHRRLPGLDEQVREETATTIHRVVGKLLHEPTVRAKELSATPEGAVYLEALSRLFGLTTTEANVR